MKKYLFFAAAAALTLASCSDDLEKFEQAQVTKDLGTAISFNTYQGQRQTTRGGEPGSINTDILKKEKYGFGVYAFYTKDKKWVDAGESTTPNWMWNQQVTYNDTEGEWTYAPTKYWPNDNADNDADNDKAKGTTNSYISFFAYAPYVGDATTGKFTASDGETGITAITSSNETGAPLISYTLDTTGKNVVDLLWGTAETAKYTTVYGATQEGDTVRNSEGKAIGKAKVNIDLTKPIVTDKVLLVFKHALSKIGGSGAEEYNVDPVTGDTTITYSKTTGGGLQAVLDIDNDGAITGGEKGDETVVTISTIKIENNNGSSKTTDYTGDGDVDDDDCIYGSGVLNLATGEWTVDTSNPTNLQHTITSDKSDSEDKENSSATLNKDLAEPESVSAFSDLPDGVTTEAQNVYEDEQQPLVFIPGTKPSFSVTVTYTVRTQDPHLDKGYTEVEQTITKNVSFDEAIELGKKYNLIMHLGLTSIKFTATVEDWTDSSKTTEGTGTGEGEGESEGESEGSGETVKDVYVPINVKSASE